MAERRQESSTKLSRGVIKSPYRISAEKIKFPACLSLRAISLLIFYARKAYPNRGRAGATMTDRDTLSYEYHLVPADEDPVPSMSKTERVVLGVIFIITPVLTFFLTIGLESEWSIF